MTDETPVPPAAAGPSAPWHLWVVGIVSLLWNAFGAYDFIMTNTQGEAYMRVAMAPATFEAIYDILGVANFSFSYSPLWLYFEYLLENKKINTDEKEQDGRRKKRRQTDMLVFLLRQFLAQPLYQAAGVKMPKKMSQVLEKVIY